MSSTIALVLFALCAIAQAGQVPPSPTGPPVPCDHQQSVRLTGTPDPGSLLQASVSNGKLGVVLTEIPLSMRDRVAALIIGQPTSFWRWRAIRQLALMNYDLVFPWPQLQRQQLPLSHMATHQWSFNFGTPTRQTLRSNGKEVDAVALDYSFSTIILSDYDSPAASSPKLAIVGGYETMSFNLPVDPTLLHQRTGNACLAEYDFPISSVDPEGPEYMYGGWCTKTNQAPAGSTNPTCKYCHCSYPRPIYDCDDALNRFSGRVVTTITFTRLAWDQATANAYRFENGHAPVTTGSNIVGWTEDLKKQQEIYRYFAPNDCALKEQCVAASGWRKVLMFHATDYNSGYKPMHIGAIPDYDGTNPVVNHGMFLYSHCHNHYHFNYYANFSWDGPMGSAGDAQKRGFCLISYYRLVNSEWSPLVNPYGFCSFQGIASGWADIYSIGIPCQWKDITAITAPQTGQLKARVNTAGMLCEGTQICENDAQTPRFEPTGLTTCSEVGSPESCSDVSKFECTESAGTLDDNTDQVDSFVAGAGASYVTNSNAAQALYTIGPLRDTEWRKLGNNQMLACTPGAVKTLSCSISNQGNSHSREPQVVRVCESSRALGVGLACRYNESLANVIIDQVAPAAVTVSFTCPAARDAVETGGVYSLYQNMVIVTDGTPKIICNDAATGLTVAQKRGADTSDV
jgi:hypothetical protein